MRLIKLKRNNRRKQFINISKAGKTFNLIHNMVKQCLVKIAHIHNYNLQILIGHTKIHQVRVIYDLNTIGSLNKPKQPIQHEESIIKRLFSLLIENRNVWGLTKSHLLFIIAKIIFTI